jgi:hypothetical protein
LREKRGHRGGGAHQPDPERNQKDVNRRREGEQERGKKRGER